VIRVHVNNLIPGMLLADDVYADRNWVIPVLLKGSVISEELIKKLKAHGINNIYVRDMSVLTFGVVPEQRPSVISPELKEEALDSIRSLFDSVSKKDIHASAQVIKHVEHVAEQLVSSIGSDHGALVNINDLRSYDEYTYHHSLSVAVLAIAIGQRLGLQEDELRNLGKCALMHDIGKVDIPIEIINKPSRLNEEEYALMKCHPAVGYDYLNNQKFGDRKLLAGLLYHHEKVDGTGYPSGLRGETIPLWSRIISVGDVYDALTSNRPYRSPLQPAEAIEYVMAGIGSAFDFNVVKAFSQKVELYPPGSIVELSNGELAVVIKSQNNLRPLVRLIDKKINVDLRSDYRYLNIVIKRAVSVEDIQSRAV